MPTKWCFLAAFLSALIARTGVCDVKTCADFSGSYHVVNCTDRPVFEFGELKQQGCAEVDFTGGHAIPNGLTTISDTYPSPVGKPNRTEFTVTAAWNPAMTELILQATRKTRFESYGMFEDETVSARFKMASDGTATATEILTTTPRGGQTFTVTCTLARAPAR